MKFQLHVQRRDSKLRFSIWNKINKSAHLSLVCAAKYETETLLSAGPTITDYIVLLVLAWMSSFVLKRRCFWIGFCPKIEFQWFTRHQQRILNPTNKHRMNWMELNMDSMCICFGIRNMKSNAITNRQVNSIPYNILLTNRFRRRHYVSCHSSMQSIYCQAQQ